LLIGVVGSVFTSSLAFASFSFQEGRSSTIVDVLLWVTIIVCFFLAAYSLVITFSVFAAVICPPLDETNLLEGLCNVEVTLADHERGWSVSMMGYNKFESQDYKAVCLPDGVSLRPTAEFPVLEFGVEDFARACRSGSIKAPAACIYATSTEGSLGYRHFNMYDRNATGQLVAFLQEEESTAAIAKSVASNISRQLEGTGRKVAIITVVVNSGGAARDSFNRSPEDQYSSLQH